MSINAGLFSSEKQDWETPQWLFDELDAEFQFTLDVCATRENRKCHNFYSPEVDGLKQDWAGNVCWMNPPYGREIGMWVEKASVEAHHWDTKVVCLLPSRTDTRWWHENVWDALCNLPRHGVEIRFLQGRLKFVGALSSAPFPSVIVIFH